LLAGLPALVRFPVWLRMTRLVAITTTHAAKGSQFHLVYRGV